MIPVSKMFFFFVSFLCAAKSHNKEDILGARWSRNNCIGVDIREITNELIRWIFPKELRLYVGSEEVLF